MRIFLSIPILFILIISAPFHHAFSKAGEPIELRNLQEKADATKSGNPQVPVKKQVQDLQKEVQQNYGCKEILEMVESSAIVAAIIGGGIWTLVVIVQRRERQPHANLTHKIGLLPVGDSKVLLHVTVYIQNTGNSLLPIRPWFTRVLRILPLSPEIEESIRNDKPKMVEGRSEIDWPLVTEFDSEWKDGEFEIEPGETHQECCDFILNTEENEVVEIHTHLKNVKKLKADLGWDLTTIYDLRNLKKI